MNKIVVKEGDVVVCLLNGEGVVEAVYTSMITVKFPRVTADYDLQGCIRLVKSIYSLTPVLKLKEYTPSPAEAMLGYKLQSVDKAVANFLLKSKIVDNADALAEKLNTWEEVKQQYKI